VFMRHQRGSHLDLYGGRRRGIRKAVAGEGKAARCCCDSPWIFGEFAECRHRVASGWQKTELVTSAVRICFVGYPFELAAEITEMIARHGLVSPEAVIICPQRATTAAAADHRGARPRIHSPPKQQKTACFCRGVAGVRAGFPGGNLAHGTSGHAYRSR